MRPAGPEGALLPEDSLFFVDRVDRPETALLQLLCCVGGNGGDGRIHLLSPCAMLFVALMTMLQQ